MKKLLIMLFTFAIAFSLAMPVFASATGAQDTTTSTKKMKKAKTKKSKAAKTTAQTQ